MTNSNGHPIVSAATDALGNELFFDGPLQVVQTDSGPATHWHRARVNLCPRQVAFVRNTNPAFASPRRHQRIFLDRPRHRGIHDVQDQLRLRGRLATPTDPLSFHRILRFPKARGVHQDQRNAANLSHFFQGVPGCSCHRRDDRSLVSQQAIEQRRLARIGSPYQGRANPLPQETPLARRAQQRVDSVQCRPELRRQHGGRVRGDVFIRKIDMGLDMRQDAHEGIAQDFDAARQRSG